MSLGDNIRQTRIAHDLTQQELAERAGVGHQMICKYEQGYKVPSVDILYRISQALFTTMDALMTGSDGKIA